MDEQVGEHAPAERPVAPPLGEDRPVERHVLRLRPELLPVHVEFVPEEHVPVDRLGVHVLGDRVVPPLADVRVAEVARLAHQHLADVPGLDVVVGQPPGRVGRRLHPDRHHPLGLPPGVHDGMASAIVRVIGFSQYTFFPAIGASIVIRACQWSGWRPPRRPRPSGRGCGGSPWRRGTCPRYSGRAAWPRVQALALAPALGRVAVPQVAGGGRGDALLLADHLEDNVDVLLAAAADADEPDRRFSLAPSTRS